MTSDIQSSVVRVESWKLPADLRQYFEQDLCDSCYVCRMVAVFREVWRVMKPQATLWLNIGDSYWANRSGNGEFGGIGNTSILGRENHGRAGGRPRDDIKPKDLIGIPWMLAFALRADGWYLRSDIIWHKPNPMPESVKDRPTKAHEYIFLLAKQRDYYYDGDAVMEIATGYDGRKDTMMKGSDKYKNSTHTFHERGHERWKFKNLQEDGQQPNTMHLKRLEGEKYMSPVRNKRSVWTVTTKPYKGAHFATFPPDLIEPCIKAGCPKDGIVLDPFVGSGTTAWVARKLGRHAVGMDLSFAYLHDQARGRLGMNEARLL